MHARLEGTQLKGNLLGDPCERDVFVYLPPSYEQDPGRRAAAGARTTQPAAALKHCPNPTDRPGQVGRRGAPCDRAYHAEKGNDETAQDAEYSAHQRIKSASTV